MGINAGMYAQDNSQGDRTMITRGDIIKTMELLIGHEARVLMLNKVDSGIPVRIQGHYGPIRFARAVDAWGEDAQ